MTSISGTRTSTIVLILLSLPAMDVSAQVSSLIEAGFGLLGVRERQFQRPPYDDLSPRKNFDFIIVGAGAAGCALTNRLTEMPDVSVLLLEAGGPETYAMGIPFLYTETPGTNWNYTYAAQPNGGCPGGPDAHCNYPLGYLLGGSTAINPAFLTHGALQDYDAWEAAGNAGWSSRNVLGYFKKVENATIDELRADAAFHGRDGPVANSRPTETPLTALTMAAAAQLGIALVDYNGAAQLGVSRLQASTLGGAHVSANAAYLLGLVRPNLFVRQYSRATKVLMEGRRAVGVEYERDGVRRRAFASKEVILSAGAINSAHLLMLSGIGPKHNIPVVQDLPVGQHFKDHPVFIGLIFTSSKPIYPTRSETLANITNTALYMVNQTGPLSTLGSASTIAWHTCGAEAVRQAWPDVEAFSLAQPNVVNRNVFGYPDVVYDKFAAPIDRLYAYQAATVVVRPRSKGTVTLQSADPRDQPLIDPNFFSDGSDMDLMVCAINKSIALFTSGPFEAYDARVYETPIPACENLTFASDEYWRCAVKNLTSIMYHPSCTCKMGPPGDPEAVVDPQLRVHGVDGLRVVDASVMHDIPAGHTAWPTYMIAERAADMVKCTLRGGSDCAAVSAG